MRKENQLYNNEIKEKFLERYSNHSSRLIAMFPLKKAKEEEERRGKDLYEMNIEELSDVISGFSSSTINAVSTNISKIEDYIMWAAKHGYRRTNLNPFPVSDRLEWSKQFVATYRRYSFTRDEIMKMVGDLINEVDQAVLLLLFEGVGGTRFSEIINLKLDDLREEDGRYMLKLIDADETTREIEISKELAKILKLADSQKEYISKNGMVEEPRYRYSELVESEYIFKRTNRGRQGGRLNNFFVNRKMLLFKEVFGHEFLKAQHFSSSGMMHMANELCEEDKVFTVEDARAIAEQFDTASTSADGKRYRSVTVIRKVVESKEFVELYDYNLNIKF